MSGCRRSTDTPTTATAVPGWCGSCGGARRPFGCSSQEASATPLAHLLPSDAIAGSSATGPPATCSGMTTQASCWPAYKELVDAAAEYYTAVQTIIPVAATSEVLFTWLYSSVVRQTKVDLPAQVFLLGSDSEPIRAEKSLYDLATWTRSQPELAESLLRTAAAEASRGGSRVG